MPPLQGDPSWASRALLSLCMPLSSQSLLSAECKLLSVGAIPGNRTFPSRQPRKEQRLPQPQPCHSHNHSHSSATALTHLHMLGPPRSSPLARQSSQGG